MSSPYEGGLDVLKAVSDADDIYEAVGLWWARSLLRVHVDTMVRVPEEVEERLERERREEKLRDAALDLRPEVQKNIAGFAEALTELMVEHGIKKISVGNVPDIVLAEAANMADLPIDDHNSIFPPMSYTEILDNDTLAMGKLGARALPKPIWPPLRGR